VLSLESTDIDVLTKEIHCLMPEWKDFSSIPKLAALCLAVEQQIFSSNEM
jgi:hypothetical protein